MFLIKVINGFYLNFLIKIWAKKGRNEPIHPKLKKTKKIRKKERRIFLAPNQIQKRANRITMVLMIRTKKKIKKRNKKHLRSIKVNLQRIKNNCRSLNQKIR